MHVRYGLHGTDAIRRKITRYLQYYDGERFVLKHFFVSISRRTVQGAVLGVGGSFQGQAQLNSIHV